jgi:GNAT superfamily N-acetyltransferase
MNDVGRFFRHYRDDRREQVIASFQRDAFDDLIRYTPRQADTEGLVVFASLNPYAASERIRQQIEYFRTRGQDFEWKVYAFDEPRDLQARLTAEGFIADEAEMLMALSLAMSRRERTTLPPDCKVERIVDAHGVDDVLGVQQQVHARDFGWLRARLVDQLSDDPDGCSIYCAYREGQPIGSGWIDFPAGSRFPELHGGAVVARARGLGVYSALFDVRLQEAARRGYEYLCVDASLMSRPILERIGFTPICTTVPLRMRFAR